MAEHDRPDDTSEGIDRRRMLKRIGAAGAIAWATPVISSLTTPAHAATSFVTCGHTCIHCDSNDDLCGAAGAFQQCFCTPHVGADECYCGEEVFCSSTHACETDENCSDLGSGWLCAEVCGCGGGQFCIPRCGSTERVAARVGGGATSAGRTL
jgi:hypothetical protein